jgi:CBS domain-containing protein
MSGNFFLQTVKDAWGKKQDVQSFTTQDSVQQALCILQANNLRMCPLLDNQGGILDLLSVFDIMRFVKAKLPKTHTLSTTQMGTLDIAGLALGKATLFDVYRVKHPGVSLSTQKAAILNDQVVYKRTQIIGVIDKLLGVSSADAGNIAGYGCDLRLGKTHVLVLNETTRQIEGIISNTDIVQLFLDHLAEASEKDDECDLFELAHTPIGSEALDIVARQPEKKAEAKSGSGTATSPIKGIQALDMIRASDDSKASPSKKQRRKQLVTAVPGLSVIDAVLTLVHMQCAIL